MQELKSLWERVEKKVIYVTLFSFFFLQFLAIFSPRIANFMDERGSLILIALVLLTMFRFLDERLSREERIGLRASEGFIEEIINLLKEKREHRLVEIFASGGGAYYPAISESKARIRELRILLRDPDSLTSTKLPSDKEDLNQSLIEIQRVVHKLHGLHKKGQISKISFGYYSFRPTFHFMIIDDETLYFGLYRLADDCSGNEFSNRYIARSNTAAGFSLLSDFRAEFKNFWNIYGQQKSS